MPARSLYSFSARELEAAPVAAGVAVPFTLFLLLRSSAMTHRSSLWLGILLLAAFVSGCKKETGAPTILESRAQPFVADVPVPKGFNLDRQKSDHTYTEGRRKIKHYYMGSEDLQAVRNFYYQKMPSGQWRLVDETLSAGVYTLKYKKFEEACEVRIEKIPARLFKPSTQIVVTVRTPHLESNN